MFDAWIIIGFINIGILWASKKPQELKWHDKAFGYLLAFVLSPVLLGYIIGDYLEDD